MAKPSEKNSFEIGSHCRISGRSGKNQKSRNNSVHAQSTSQVRIYFLALFVIAVALAIFFRLWSLQIILADSYRAIASNQHSIFKDLVPKRGEIYLKDGAGIYPVAVNHETKMAYAVPREMENTDATAREISKILDLDENYVRGKISDSKDVYEILKHRLSDSEISAIGEAKIEGVHLADESYRYYPAGELAAPVLGFVGWKDNQLGGRYGLEAYFEDQLKGQAGSLWHKKDATGRWITLGERDLQRARDGDFLILTIDHIVQYESEKILKSAIDRYGANRGSIIVMETSTAKILAMANYPSFNPNEYGQVDNIEVFRNISVSDAYEPGSVFKTFTLAGAIDAGRISPETTYYDSGEVREAGYTIKNSDLKVNGRQTMTQVLEKSLNTGVIFVEKLLGNRNFSEYIRRFGFGEPTGAEIFSEARGNILNLLNYDRDIEFFTAAFGQGISVTPLQLISAYNAIANGGILLKPQIIEKVVHSDGSSDELSAEEVRRVISASAAEQVSKMLESVVKNGHGKRAGVPGHLVGGKTGTAQIAKRDSAGYEEKKSIGSFCGFAPIGKPRYTILVRLDEPKNVEWAESSAAPVFGELMKFLLEYGRVEPTQKYAQKDIDVFNATHTLRKDFIKKEDDKQE